MIERISRALPAVAVFGVVLCCSAGAVETKFRIQYGANVSRLTDDAVVTVGGDPAPVGPEPVTGAATGMYFAGLVEFRRSDRFALETALAYSRKGGTGVELDVQNLGKDVLFLVVPIRAKIAITGDRLYCLAGVGVGITVSAEEWGKAPGRPRAFTDVTDAVEGSEIALEFGFGCRFGGDRQWSIDAVYSIGLSDMDGATTTFKTRAVNFALGYAF